MSDIHFVSSAVPSCQKIKANSFGITSHWRLHFFRIATVSFLLWGSLISLALAEDVGGQGVIHRVTVPILGTTLNRHWEQIGVVAEVQIEFERRYDHDGLRVQFQNSPGRFSPLAQQAVLEAIRQVVKVSHLDSKSWSVTLTLPYQGLTMYGESLSGMVGLSVLALAKGDPVPRGRVLTGTITSNGHIGVVGGVPLKIVAAYEHHLLRVLIPEEIDVADGAWENPFLMEISPVGTIRKAYHGLTDRSLDTPPVSVTISTLAAK